MNHFHTRLAQLKEILASYKYPVPFSEHLKFYFSKHKNAGSKDRREIRALSYAYFRISHALEGETIDKIAEYAVNLIENEGPIEDFINTIPEFKADQIFPFGQYVSEPFHNREFQLSFLAQPRVWIKIAPGKIKDVMAELNSLEIVFEIYEDEVLSFGPEISLTALKSYSIGYFRIQDLSSQTVCKTFNPSAGENWWDCCAGSGGKSLALMEQQPGINLYASDIRESILNNLAQRHTQASTGKINIFAADLSQTGVERKLPPMDGIIVDAPCSGSGTWARNPENLHYFNAEAIAEYQSRQLAILKNVYPFLKHGKPLIYITCSVFTMENEEVINQFTAQHSLEIEDQKYIKGYEHGAENMFLCRMIKTA